MADTNINVASLINPSTLNTIKNSQNISTFGDQITNINEQSIISGNTATLTNLLLEKENLIQEEINLDLQHQKTLLQLEGNLPPVPPPSSITSLGMKAVSIAAKKQLDAMMNDEDEAKLKTVNTPIADAYRKIKKDFMAWSGRTNKTLRLNSGGRDAQSNLHVGGAKDSAHLRNNALDIKLSPGSRTDVLYIIKLATKYGIMGMGIYRDAEDIHIDIDPKLIKQFGGKRAWGPGYGRSGVPAWAEKAIQDFLNNKY
jgi:uncharacterized protein YcbK (DUF882 family)